MELNEMKALMAASLLGGAIGSFPDTMLTIRNVQDSEITAAVQIAQKIWEEVRRQERE
jgi:hypothetical protein